MTAKALERRSVLVCTCQRCGYAWMSDHAKAEAYGQPAPSSPAVPRKCPRCQAMGWQTAKGKDLTVARRGVAADPERH